MSLCSPPLIETYCKGAVCPSCLLVQFSFKSTTETSECKVQIVNSQWQRVPDRRARSGIYSTIVIL